MTMRIIEVDKKYRHFKGNYYYVMAIAILYETMHYGYMEKRIILLLLL